MMATDKHGFIKWDDELEQALFTPQEIQQNNLKAQLICEIAAARKAQGISQRKLEVMSGLKQSAIARMESGASSPTIDTLIKILEPMGKTLTIVPIKGRKAGSKPRKQAQPGTHHAKKAAQGNS